MFPDPDPTPESQAGRVSRRSLLQLSLLTAAAPAAVALDGSRSAAAWAAAAAGTVDIGIAYRRRFQAIVREDRDVRGFLASPGREFLYRPNQLLTDIADTQRVIGQLREWGFAVKILDRFAGVDQLEFSNETDIPALVSRLRDPRQAPVGRPPLRVQPHHVTLGHDVIMGNPGAPPEPAPPLTPPILGSTDGQGVTVGICDTGIWREADVFHAPWLGGAYAQTLGDEDPLYQPNGLLDVESGHGTFVAGVLRQAAPAALCDIERALSDSGIGDEKMLVDALNGLSVDTRIVNLSLGCMTADDVESMPISFAINNFTNGALVVASAGNGIAGRKVWPAAMPNVLAVGAAVLDSRSRRVVRAQYSNYGSWVDVCAEGERISTYVPGGMELLGAAPIVFTGFARWQGTSFAAPHVAGRLATLMSQNPGLSADAARTLLLSNSSHVPVTDCGVFIS